MICGMMQGTGAIMKIIPKVSQMMGVDTPIPPVAMNAAAPDGALPRRIRTVRDNSLLRLRSNRLAPPCPGVRVVYQNREDEKNAAFFDSALRRGALVGFPGANRCSASARFMNVSPERKQQQNGVIT